MTIDLLTGEDYQPRREDMITKQAGCHLDATPPTPLWDAFLDRVTGADTALRSYLQRVAGYAMTGHTYEHVLFFAFGSGANGKSVFINTLAGIWGDYATVAPMDLFMRSRYEQHPTGLASLRGARLVVATETDDGAHWSEAKIKRLTGGDPITARWMRGDHFTYTPQFKLFVAGNHLPALRNVDEAMRRRIHLIPFTVTIPMHERDDLLPDKLKAEWPGILSWCIDGSLEWREHGLRPPEAVRSATEEYLQGEDSFTTWLDECVEDAPHTFTATAELYDSYKAFMTRAGEETPSQKKFVMTMKDRDFAQAKETGGKRRGFTGIRLVRRNYTDDLRCGD